MKILDTVYALCREKKLSAYNQVSHKGLCLCVNFIQVATAGEMDGIAVDTSIMTVSIMKNRKKKNALEPSRFAQVMNVIEETMSSLNDCEEHPYFSPLTKHIPPKWYSLLNCHRVFLLPTTYIFSTAEKLFEKDKIARLNHLGLAEVSVILSTDSHDSSMQFYAN